MATITSRSVPVADRRAIQGALDAAGFCGDLTAGVLAELADRAESRLLFQVLSGAELIGCEASISSGVYVLAGRTRSTHAHLVYGPQGWELRGVFHTEDPAPAARVVILRGPSDGAVERMIATTLRSIRAAD